MVGLGSVRPGRPALLSHPPTKGCIIVGDNKRGQCVDRFAWLQVDCIGLFIGREGSWRRLSEMEICEGSKKDGKEKLVTSENTGSAM